jgi:hypothetical protein
MADNTVINCPECKKKFKGKGDLEGKKIKCPFCAKAFVVPSKNAGAATMATADDDDETGYGVTALDLQARCPHCAKPMESDTAIICLFCGYNTVTRELGKTEKVIGLKFSDVFWYQFPGMLAAFGCFLLLLGMLFFNLVMPSIGPEFLNHESMRLWICSIFLGGTWAMGTFAFSRLVLHPFPEEERKH